MTNSKELVGNQQRYELYQMMEVLDWKELVGNQHRAELNEMMEVLDLKELVGTQYNTKQNTGNTNIKKKHIYF